jgi:hypothetical protein
VRHPIASLAALFTNWQWLAGFGTGLSGWALYIAALRLAPLSLVQAVSACGVGLLALLVRMGGGRLSRPERVAVAASVGGLLLLGLSLPAGTGHPAPAGWAAPLGWVLASVVLAGIAAFPAAAALSPGAGLAAAAGLLYSAGDVATKAAVGGTSPVPLFAAALLACHGLAFMSLQLAFQRGTVLATAGVSTLLTNAAPILAGLTVFAEPIPGGAAGALRGLGFAAAVLGAVLLAATGRTGTAGPADEAHAAGSAGGHCLTAASARRGGIRLGPRLRHRLREGAREHVPGRPGGAGRPGRDR